MEQRDFSMNYFLHCILVTTALLLSLVLSPAVLRAGYQVLHTIDFEKAGQDEVVRLQLSSKIEPTIFEIPGEKPRIVLDFKNTIYPLKKSTTIQADGELISKIRVGRHAEPVAKTRVVMDMVVGVDYSFIKEFNVSDKSLSVIVSRDATGEIKEIEPVKPQADGEAFVEDLREPEEPTKQPEEVNDESEPTVESSPDKDLLPLEAIEETKSPPSREQIRLDESESNNKALQPAQPKEPEAVLFDVSYEKTTNGKEMVLFQLSGFFPPVVYSTEENNLYVVCEFLNVVSAEDLASTVSSGDDYIRSITISEHEEPAKVRVVIELFNTYDYDLKQVFFKEDNLFVIILSRLGQKK